MTNRRLDLSFLDPANNEGYGNWPLPCARDKEVAAFVRVLTQADAERPHARYVPVLVAFAERMATLARREGSPERLRIGLAAAGLASCTGDQHEPMLVLPLL